ncbi:MAG: hypothetical protein AAF958_03410 [Planctomycetota bacterium]
MFARCCLIWIAVSCLWNVSSPPAVAQRGGLVQDLFRTLAEAQLEREQRKRIEAQRFPNGQPVPNGQLVPNGLGGGGFGGQTVPIPTRPNLGGTLPGAASRIALPTDRNAIAAPLDILTRDLTFVVNDLRTVAARNAAARAMLPGAYRLAAGAQTLSELLRQNRAADPRAAVCGFDRDFRKFSQGMLRLPGLSSNCRDALGRCDNAMDGLASLYSISLQWDRAALADIALITQVQLQTILDDLEVLALSRQDRRAWTHDLRLLAHRIDELRGQMDVLTYDEAVAAFNEFSNRMVPLGKSLRSLHNPHVDRRLDRLRELVDQTYSVLLMPTPLPAGSILESAERLEAVAETLRDDLDRDATRALPRKTRDRMDDLVRAVDNDANDLVRELRRQNPEQSRRRGAGDEITEWLRSIDSKSHELSNLVRYLPGNHHAGVVRLHDETEALMRALQVVPGVVIDYARMLQTSASLEGAAEALRDQLRRVDRELGDAGLRSTLRRSSDDLYRAARDFNEAVDDRRDVDDLARLAERLIQPWQTLNENLDRLVAAGASRGSAARVQSFRNAMTQPMAEAVTLVGLE